MRKIRGGERLGGEDEGHGALREHAGIQRRMGATSLVDLSSIFWSPECICGPPPQTRRRSLPRSCGLFLCGSRFQGGWV